MKSVETLDENPSHFPPHPLVSPLRVVDAIDANSRNSLCAQKWIKLSPSPKGKKERLCFKCKNLKTTEKIQRTDILFERQQMKSMEKLYTSACGVGIPIVLRQSSDKFPFGGITSNPETTSSTPRGRILHRTRKCERGRKIEEHSQCSKHSF